MIHREDRGTIAVLRIQNGKANALDTDFFDALEDQFEYLEISDHRAVVLTGTGSIFSAGVDLQRVLDGGVNYLRQLLPSLSRGLKRLFTFPRPLVAAVNGHAIAGGCILSLACDHRVLSSGKAKVGVSELKVGVPFPVTAMEVLRYQLENRVAQDLIYTGRLVGPEEAVGLGLADELAAPEAVLDRSIEVAIELGNVPSSTFALTKRHLRGEVLDRIQQQELRLEDEIVRQWCEPRTMAAIRTFMQATVGKR